MMPEAGSAPRTLYPVAPVVEKIQLANETARLEHAEGLLKAKERAAGERQSLAEIYVDLDNELRKAVITGAGAHLDTVGTKNLTKR